jgi:hypothetical protein
MSMDPHLTPEQEQREEQFFDQTWWEIPLSPDVVKFFQEMGANWDRRINIVLRMFISNRGVHPTVDTYETVEAVNAKIAAISLENERLNQLVGALREGRVEEGQVNEEASVRSDAVVSVTGVDLGSGTG